MMDIELPPTIVRHPLPLEPLEPAEFHVLLTDGQDSTDMKKPWAEGTSSGSTDGSESRISDREQAVRPYSAVDQGRKAFRRAPTGKSSFSYRGTPSDSSRPYSVLDVSKWQGQSGDTRTEVVDMLRKLQVEVDTLREFLDERKRARDSGIYESIETKTFPRNRKKQHGDSLVRYASTMGLYRLRYLIDTNICALRRFCWLILFMCCLAKATYLIQDRVRTFLSYASDTTVETRYVESLSFPAVTICNLNKYRLTPTASKNLYDVLHNYVHGRGTELGKLGQNKYLDSKYVDFLNSTAHQKTKLIYSCRFRNSRCTADNFQPMFTDHGLCYTFRLKPEPYGSFRNTGHGQSGSPRNSDHDQPSTIRKAGPESGLSLLLNVEQYEYLLGPKSAVGVKVAVHDPDVIPSMRADSLHASVGSRSSLAISKVEFRDLPVPYGECVEDGFRLEPCSLQCDAQYAKERYNCSLPYSIRQPKETLPPGCSLKQALFLGGNVGGTRLSGRNCSCFPPCDHTEYDIQLSHAMMSTYSAESEVRMLHDHSALQREFRTARDKYQRLDEEIYHYDINILTNLTNGLTKSLQYLNEQKRGGDMGNYDDGFDKDLEQMRSALKDLNKTVQDTFQPFDKASHVSFITFAERLIPELERIIRYKSMVDNLYTHSPEVIQQKLGEILPILERLTLETATSSPATSEIIKGVNSFRKDILEGYGQKYKEFRESRIYYDITTQVLLNFTNYIKDTLWEQYKFVKNATQKSDFKFLTVKRKLSDFFRAIQQLETRNVPDLGTNIDDFFNVYVSHKRKVQELSKQLNVLGTEFTIAADVVKKSSQQLRTSLEVLQKWLKQVVATVTEQKVGYSSKRFYKTAMAEKLNSETMKTSLKEAEDSLGKINAAFHDAMKHLQSLVVKIQPISTRFADFGLKNVSNLNDKLNKTTLQKEAEFLSVTLADNLLLIKQYQGELKEYLDMNKLDGDFFLNNFLQLEVYYQDLTETVISQHSRYGLIDLACDIGGTMALYLGASILTIFELLDFLMKALNFCLCRPRDRVPPQSTQMPLAS